MSQPRRAPACGPLLRDTWPCRGRDGRHGRGILSEGLVQAQRWASKLPFDVEQALVYAIELLLWF